MKRFTLRIVIPLFWLLAMLRIYQKEVLPLRRLELPYRKFIPQDLLIRDEWFGIYFRNEKLGYANYNISLEEKEARSGYRIKAEAYLIMPVLGKTNRIWFQADAYLNSSYRAHDFNFILFTGKARTEIRGKRITGTKYLLTIKEPGSTIQKEVNIPDGVVFSLFFGPPKEIVKPKVGQRYKFLLYDPFTLKLEPVELHVLAKEVISYGGRNINVYRIRTKFLGLESESLIDEDSRLIKEETPLGIVVKRETQDEALNFVASKRRVDFAEIFAIKANRKLKPQNLKKLVVRIKAKNIDLNKLANHRQKIVSLKEDTIKEVILEINRSSIYKKEKQNFSPYLKATPLAQSNNPQINSIAQYLTHDKKNEKEKVDALLTWVNKYLMKKATISIPSAVNALKMREGDCNEHTFLFTALARAANIPTKVLNGLVYLNGKFYYHSWPAVYLSGRWIDVDPTLNQKIADPTHIMLVEGELTQQFDLLKLLGKIEIEVIAYE